MTPIEAAKRLRAQLKEAAKDARYPNKGHSQFNGRTEKDFGAVSFPKAHWTNESASLVLGLKNEIDQIADKFNIPRIRGIKHGTGAYGANMGDGVMQLNADSFAMYARGLNVDLTTMSLEARRAKVAELMAERQKLKETNIELRNKRDALKQGTEERRIANVELADGIKKRKALFQEAASLTNDSLNKSEWKTGDPIKDRPFVGDAYANTRLDKARHTMFHEMGHHVHEYFGNMFKDGMGGKLNRANYTRPLESWLRSHKSEISPLKDGFGKSQQKAKADIIADTSEANLRQFSHYAQYNGKEWFAENFAQYFMGYTNRVDPVFVKLIESVLNGKVPA